MKRATHFIFLTVTISKKAGHWKISGLFCLEHNPGYHRRLCSVETVLLTICVNSGLKYKIISGASCLTVLLFITLDLRLFLLASILNTAATL